MTGGLITLNQEEQRRGMVLSNVLEGMLVAKDAAKLLGMSIRHCRRLLAAFRRPGPAALAHGNRGRSPHSQLPERVHRRVLRLAKTTYAGFNDHHLTEMLLDGYPRPRPRTAPRQRPDTAGPKRPVPAPYRPPADHPWRQAAVREVRRPLL